MPALTLDDLFRCTSDGLVVFALDADERPVHVDSVQRGKACGCHCPECGRPLIARQGSLAHSFAHESNSANPACASAGETVLHKVAKEHLAEALVLTLPERMVTKGSLSAMVVKEGDYHFDRADVEYKLSGMKPDVLVHKGDRPLLVEFKVTHACGDEKIARIREQELAAIEIDLAPYRDRKLDEIGPIILHEAKRIWLNNPKDKNAELKLDNQLRKIEEDNRTEAKRRLAAYRVRSPSDGRLGKITTDYGLSEAVGHAVAGAGTFNVPFDVWQSSILLALCSVGSTFSVEKIVKHLDHEELVRKEFKKVSSGVRAIMAQEVGFQEDAVAEFLRLASKGGWVTRVGDAWARSAKLINTVKEAIELRERPFTRRKQLDEIIDALLDLVPQEDLRGFDLDVWWTKEIPSLGKSPSVLLSADEEEWIKFESSVSRFQHRLTWRPEQIEDTLGLPIAADRDRRIDRRVREEEDRRKEKERQAAEDAENRSVKIRQKAVAVLNVQAQEWLRSALVELAGRTPLEASIHSDGEYENARYLLETENSRRRRQRFENPVRHAALEQLDLQARRALGDEAGGTWMQSDNRYLNEKTPYDHCVSVETLDECREALNLAKLQQSPDRL